MSKSVILFPLFLFVLTIASMSQLTLDDGLIAYYKFDNTSGPVVDSKGTYHGTNVGATRGVCGVHGNAFSFNGSTSHVLTLPKTAIPTTITISLWIKPEKLVGRVASQFLGSVSVIHAGQHGFVLNYYETDLTSNGLPHSYAESVVAVHYHELGKVLGPRYAFPLATWTHLTYTCDSSNNVKLYSNGTLVASGFYSVAPTIHENDLMIGEGIDSQDLGFKGCIDEVKIWNRPLSESEVQSLLCKTVNIDIKPCSYPNSINLGSKGVVPVAILSTSSFDAATVDPATVCLSGSEVAVRGKGDRLMASLQDVNNDGLMDLVIQVETENLDPGKFQGGYAVLTGKTYGSVEIRGIDEINIVP